MKRNTSILTFILLTLLSTLIFGFITQRCSRSNANSTTDEMVLSYLGYFKATITKEIVYGETPYGIRHDNHYEGEITGNRLSGQMSGIDYMTIRPDGINEVNTRAAIETTDGANISAEITGYVYDDGNITNSYARFLSGYDKYKWMNDTVFFGKGRMLSPNTFEIFYYYYSGKSVE